MRRNRKADWTRRLVQENRLTVDDLIWPIFIVPGSGIVDPIKAMPGVNRMSVDKAVEALKEAADLGIPRRCPLPRYRDGQARPNRSEILSRDNLINQFTRAVKKAVPNLASLPMCARPLHKPWP